MSTDAELLVKERLTQLLDEVDPKAVSMEELRGKQYEKDSLLLQSVRDQEVLLRLQSV